MKTCTLETLVCFERFQPLLALAALSATLVSCGGGGGGGNAQAADASFNISRAAFNDRVIAIAPVIDGAIDPGFAIGSGFDFSVTVIAPAMDGSGDVYVGGVFTDYDGAGANRIARLNANGTMDSEFALGSGFDDEVTSIAPLTDGSGDVYVGGYFSNYDGAGSNGIIRLNANGTRDTGFSSGTGFDAPVQAVALATDGSGDVYVGGEFEFYNGMSSNRVIRLNSDGTVDSGFAVGSGFDSCVFEFAPTRDGSGDVYAAGLFVSFNGTSSGGIIRLNANGTVDTDFAVGTGFNRGSISLALATDGSGDVYVVGFFTIYDGANSGGIIRLNSDGTADPGFNVGAGFDDGDFTNPGAFAVALATDGSGDVYAGGTFTSYNGVESNRIIRINSNGSKDTGLAVGTGFESFINAIAPAIDGSGDVYVGGTFLEYNGTSSSRIIRLEVGRTVVGGAFLDVNDSIESNHIGVLNADDSLDRDFDIGAGFDFDVLALAPVPDGSGDVYVGGQFLSYGSTGSNFLIRLNSDGTSDTNFNVGAGFSDTVTAIAPTTDGSGDVHVGGFFSSYNGTNSGKIIRLKADGSIESSFNASPGFSAEVHALVAATDGSFDVYVGGEFFSYKGVSANRIIRLNGNGSRDNGFNIGAGFSNGLDIVFAIAPTVDGTTDVYVGGRFADYDGASSNNIIRLNSNGTVDTSFDVGLGFDGTVFAIAPATDGSDDVYIGGSFLNYDGASANGIVRLHSDGSRVAGFVVGSGFDDQVRSIAVATDDSGDVHVGGNFSSFKGVGSNGMIRLDANGDVRTGFGLGAGFDDFVFAIAPAEDGSSDVYFGGDFNVHDGASSKSIIRLNSNGTRDAGFVVGAGFDSPVEALAPATDGSGDVYVGGRFSFYGTTSAKSLIRLNSDGTGDLGFATGAGFNDCVQSLALATDGSGDLYAGGNFNQYNGTNSSGIIRINANGTPDTGFAIGGGIDGTVEAIAIATNGSGDVYVGGRFLEFDGTAAINLIRLNANGTRDTAFAVGSGFDGGVNAIAPAKDGSGDVYVGGDFTIYNGAASIRLIRLNSDGSVDTAFAVGAGFDGSVFAITPLTDSSGSIYVAGAFTRYAGVSSNGIARLQSNGMRDPSFQVGAGFEIGDALFVRGVRAMAEATDGSSDLYLGGTFTQYDRRQVDFAVALNADGSLD